MSELVPLPPMTTAPQHGKKIALALGAGGARGWAHIGVIEALRELEVPIDIVCGCSSGALVGASFATGKFDALAELARSMTLFKMASFFDFSGDGGGLIEGKQVLAFFEENVDDVSIESAAVRFGAVAADLESGREVWFTSGSIIDAVRASIALPGLLTPFKVRNHWMVDGTLVNPLPASMCWAMGADIVIAVNLSGDVTSRAHLPLQSGKPDTPKTQPQSSWLNQVRQLLPFKTPESAPKPPPEKRPSYVEVIANSFLVMHNFITRVRLAVDPVDVLIAPDVEEIGVLEFHKAEPAIKAGYDAVMKNKDAIIARIERARAEAEREAEA